MRKKITTTAKRLFAFILTAVITVGTLAANQLPVHAADGTLNFPEPTHMICFPAALRCAKHFTICRADMAMKKKIFRVSI